MTLTDVPTLRQYAARNVGRPADEPADATRGAFLAVLPGSDFVPSDEWRAGVALADPAGTERSFALTAVRRASRHRLQEQVREFASDFWTIPPDERRAILERLQAECVNEPPLKRYLMFLADGVHVDGAKFDTLEGPANEIGTFIKETFPQLPPRRAVRRNEWLAGKGGFALGRMRTALLNAAPEIAELDPALMLAIDARSREQQATPVRRYYDAPTEPLESRRGKSESARSWLAIMIVFFVIGALKGVLLSDRDTKPTYEPPRYQSMPTFKFDPLFYPSIPTLKIDPPKFPSTPTFKIDPPQFPQQSDRMKTLMEEMKTKRTFPLTPSKDPLLPDNPFRIPKATTPREELPPPRVQGPGGGVP